MLNKSLSLINAINKWIDIAIAIILDVGTTIAGPIVAFIIGALHKLLSKVSFGGEKELFSTGIHKIKKLEILKNGGATIADNIIWKNALKITILAITTLFVVDVVKKMKFMKIRNEQSKEEKEKIYKNGKGKLDYKNNISTILKKVFRINNTIKEKILNIYRDFEKTTEKAEIYKSSMTATQLKNTTKENIENHNYLDEMTDIYNEVKFSNYEPSEEQLDLVKKALNNVKKQL